MSTSPHDYDFLYRLKRHTEAVWANAVINRTIHGFQIQAGTRWNPGLDERRIREFEQATGTRFPDDFRRFLRCMNGTDIPTLNVYADSGEPHRFRVGFYAYPRDLAIVTSQMADVAKERSAIQAALRDQGFELHASAVLVPLYGHRFLLCGSDSRQSIVLSIVGSDAIIYGATLREYLQNELVAPAEC